jgi:ribosomal protein S18 acetylase RimI-like enzyme
MHIRPATLGDHAALCSIDSVVLHGGTARRHEIETWLHVGTCKLMESNGQVAAYGVLTNHFFGSPFIEMLMVGSQFRRHGFGIALISHLRAACSGSKLFSSTNMSNVPMQALLIKAGFRPSGYIDNLDENDPEIVFYSLVP